MIKIPYENLIAYILFIFALGFVLGTRVVYNDAKKAGCVVEKNGKYIFIKNEGAK